VSTVTNQSPSANAAEATDHEALSPPVHGVMHIGEVAARTEEVGLLTPSSRTEGGFRLYTEADVDKIMVIRRMKPLGFSLDQMKAAMADIETLAKDEVAQDAQDRARDRLRSTQQDAVERRQKLVDQLAMADEFLELISGRLV
jgi:MerR family copper efflux transcriptional regulator